MYISHKKCIIKHLKMLGDHINMIIFPFPNLSKIECVTVMGTQVICFDT